MKQDYADAGHAHPFLKNRKAHGTQLSHGGQAERLI